MADAPDPLGHVREGDPDPAPDRHGGTVTTPDSPADPVTVQADDALLDALGRNVSPHVGGDAQLTQVFLAWRYEVDTEPMTPLVDTDTALALMLKQGRWQRLLKTLRRWPRWMR